MDLHLDKATFKGQLDLNDLTCEDFENWIENKSRCSSGRGGENVKIQHDFSYGLFQTRSPKRWEIFLKLIHFSIGNNHNIFLNFRWRKMERLF